MTAGTPVMKSSGSDSVIRKVTNNDGGLDEKMQRMLATWESIKPHEQQKQQQKQQQQQSRATPPLQARLQQMYRDFYDDEDYHDMEWEDEVLAWTTQEVGEVDDDDDPSESFLSLKSVYPLYTIVESGGDEEEDNEDDDDETEISPITPSSMSSSSSLCREFHKEKDDISSVELNQMMSQLQSEWSLKLKRASGMEKKKKDRDPRNSSNMRNRRHVGGESDQSSCYSSGGPSSMRNCRQDKVEQQGKAVARELDVRDIQKKFLQLQQRMSMRQRNRDQFLRCKPRNSMDIQEKFLRLQRRFDIQQKFLQLRQKRSPLRRCRSDVYEKFLQLQRMPPAQLRRSMHTSAPEALQKEMSKGSSPSPNFFHAYYNMPKPDDDDGDSFELELAATMSDVSSISCPEESSPKLVVDKNITAIDLSEYLGYPLVMVCIVGMVTVRLWVIIFGALLLFCGDGANSTSPQPHHQGNAAASSDCAAASSPFFESDHHSNLQRLKLLAA